MVISLMFLVMLILNFLFVYCVSYICNVSSIHPRVRMYALCVCLARDLKNE